jgi:hypothetical protein
LPTGVIGSTGSSSAVAFVQDTYLALAADASSALDAAAVASLSPLTPSAQYPGLAGLTVTGNDFAEDGFYYSDQATRLDNDGSANNVALSVNTSVLKALGFTEDANGDPLPTDPDGDITFSSNFGFDFDPTNGIDANTFDFIGVAIHEIGHALGFVSGVDLYDYFTYNDPSDGPYGILEYYAVGSTLDLFRYSGLGQLDWSTSDSVKYFSIDGGATQLFGDSRFATGVYNGDGDQASHWKDSPGCGSQIGIMDPTACFGQADEVTAQDLAAFDAMGWDLNLNILANPGYRRTTAQIFDEYTGVPEPSSWAMMIAGFGFVGAAMRRAQVRKVVFAS